MRFFDKRPALQKQPDRALLVFSIMSIVLYAALAAWFLLNYFSAGQRQVSLTNALIYLIAWAVDSSSFLALRKAKPTILCWLLLVTLLVTGVYPALFYSGIGFVVYFGAFVLAFIFATSILPGQQFNRLLIVGFVGLLCVYLLDAFGASDRLTVFLPAIAAGIAAVILFIFVLWLWFKYQEFPYRSKVVYAVVLVAGISILVITAATVNSLTQSMSREGNQSLETAAYIIANSVDDFILVSAGTLEAEAQIPLFQELLNNPDPAADELALVQELLRKLATRGELVGSGKNYFQHIEDYFLLDASGKVILATQESQAGQDHSQRDYFLQSYNKQMTYISPVIISETGTAGIYFSTQIRGDNNELLGILVTRYNASVLQQIILGFNNQVGDQSFGLLVDEYGVRLAQGNAPSAMYKLIVPDNFGEVNMLRQQGRLPGGDSEVLSADAPDLGSQLQLHPGTSSILYKSGEFSDGPFYLAGTQYLRTMPWTAVFIQSQAVIQQPVIEQIRLFQSLGLLCGVLAIALAFAVSRRLIRPILDLTSTAEVMASGNLSSRAVEKPSDEFGMLTTALNRVAENLQKAVLGMEHEVEVRTRDLEKHSRQLQAAAEVGRAVATIRELGELLDRSTRLVSERFNYYHVGIFLVDEAGRFAVLRAANSEGGKRMLARSHRLAVGQQGIVGFVTSTGKPRIALDVGADAVFFNNPDLPATRSEMALPLVSGDRILGALDVQSTESGAFTSEDISVLQVLADLLAVALENARLFVESQNALESIRRAYGEVSRRSWVERLVGTTAIGFHSRETGVVSVSEEPLQGVRANVEMLSVPIYVRDELIGYVEAYKPIERGAWTAIENETIKTLVDQLGVALESARLYESSQIQAERERLVSEFTARLQENLDVEAVLNSAAAEIRKMLDSSEVTIVLGEDRSK